jgi:hypothetical protein
MALLTQPGGIPAVATVQPKTGWWTGNNQLGTTQAYQASSVNRQTILKMDENGPPEIWTIALGLQYNGDFDEGENFNMKAVINFGVGGATETITMDWILGAMISLPLNSVNVIVEYTGVSIGEGQNITAIAQVAKGFIPHGKPRITIAENITVGPGANSKSFVIPAFVEKIFIAGADDPSTTNDPFSALSYLIILGDGANSGWKTGAQLVYDGLPVTGTGKTVSYSNTTANTHNLTIYGELYG